MTPNQTYRHSDLPDYAWLIETSSGMVHADGLSSAVPAIPIGETETFEFRFYTQRYVGTDPPGDKYEHVDRYRHLLDYQAHAGMFDLGNVVRRSRVRYLETHRDDSLLVRLEPTYKNPTTDGLWGLVASIEDQSLQPDELAILSIDVVKLADISEYDTREELEQELQSGGP